MNRLGAAVVGTGFMGETHVEALRRLPGVAIVGILGSSLEKSRRAADKLGLEKAFSSFEEVMSDDSVQVVHITTPNYLHHGMARDALKAGKHVMCEKPLAMNSAESGELVTIARQSGMIAGVNYNIRFYPLNLESRDTIRRGDLGEVYSVCGSYVQDWLLCPTDYDWRVDPRLGGSLRAFGDIGSHWLDLVQFMTGLEVEAVCADLRTVHPRRYRPRRIAKGSSAHPEMEEVDVTTEDYGCVMLRFRSGARGCLWVSQVTAGRKNCVRYEIAGSARSLAWCSEQPNELWYGRREQVNESLIRDPNLVSDTARAFITYPGGHNEGFADTFKQCFRAFYEHIKASDRSVPFLFASFSEGHKEIVLLEAIMRSHIDGRWVTVPEGGAS